MVSLFRSKSRIRLIPGLALTLAAQRERKMMVTVVMAVHRTTRKPILENRGSPTIPWATPTVNGFMKAVANPALAPPSDAVV
jgi:hypothetical protein